MRSLILPTFGSIPINRISRPMIEQWIDDLYLEGKAPSTIRKAFQLVARPLRRAAEEGRIRRPPTEHIELPPIEPDERRFLSVEEIRQLADVIDVRYRAMVLLAATTGARYGELAAVRRNRLDLKRRTLTIDSSLTADGRSTPPKTSASRRTIKLPKWIIPVMRQHLADHAGDDLVFAAPSGKPLRRTHFRTRFWMPAVRASVGEPCPFHSLRHTHVALAIEQGVHPKAIQARLGHKDIRTTLQVYGHLFDGFDDAAADAMDEAFADNMRTREADNVIPLDV